MWKRREKFAGGVLYLGDCLEIVPTLDGVRMVATDPPHSSGGQAVGVVAMFFVLSTARAFAMRRLFRWLEGRDR